MKKKDEKMNEWIKRRLRQIVHQRWRQRESCAKDNNSSIYDDTFFMLYVFYATFIW
jgi:hypothetical protein